ncbi:hypothetical protein [Acetivibrio straminisolvens]|jgi:hypothetical protein|uniref:hypothetical protein n=1 Tax=Acetivibrio straminisolvens TaxID=253314 RepID=UPI0022402041|nr:hypothetical protein [Acetivibrio straminisolvens]
MKEITIEELQRAVILAKEKRIMKPRPIKIPKKLKYDQITITKRRLWKEFGLWID